MAGLLGNEALTGMFPWIGTVMPFSAWIATSPEVPAFYWNVRSGEQRILAICKRLGELTDYADQLADAENVTRKELMRVATLAQELQGDVNDLRDEMANLARGGRVRNPVSGDYSLMYTAAKQVYDLLRPRAITWAEMANSGRTWEQMAGDGYTYAEIELFGNEYYGDNTEHAHVTPPESIDAPTPGFGYNPLTKEE